jgi:hypothetical protein
VAGPSTLRSSKTTNEGCPIVSGVGRALLTRN